MPGTVFERVETLLRQHEIDFRVLRLRNGRGAET
jgi:hypothetical protein